MAENTNTLTTDEAIKQLYGGKTPVSTQMLQGAYNSALEAQKSSLEADYNKAIADLGQQKENNQKATDANLTRTSVEAQRARNNYAETANAYGLTSGAAAQARLAQNNDELRNLTTIRATQQEQDAQIERQRGILSDQYAAALRQAQANNDYNLAMQIYEDAKQQEKTLNNATTSSGGGGAASANDDNKLLNFYGGSKSSGAAGVSAGANVAAAAAASAANITVKNVLQTVQEQYAAGQSQKNIDGYLRELVANGTISQAQATEIRDARR